MKVQQAAKTYKIARELPTTSAVPENGRPATIARGLARTITETSPEGRAAITTLNDKGRRSRESVAGIEPIAYGYDERGNLSSMSRGNRSATFTYNTEGHLIRQENSAGQSFDFAYDSAERLTSMSLPPDRVTRRYLPTILPDS